MKDVISNKGQSFEGHPITLWGELPPSYLSDVIPDVMLFSGLPPPSEGTGIG